MIEETTWPEFLNDFDSSLHEQLKTISCRYGVVALVLFENVQMDSSAFGRRTALAVGPNCTYKSVAACEGRWLNDSPSQRQYPQKFTKAPCP